MFATMLYPRHICMLKSVLFSFFPSSLRLISGPTTISPQQYWYLGQEYCLLSNALTCASILTSWVSIYLVLQNCSRSRYTRGVCNIVLPAEYLYGEGCIVFTCFFVSEAYIRSYNIVSSAVLIHRPPGVSPPQQCSYLGVCIESSCELQPWPAELSSQQIS